MNTRDMPANQMNYLRMLQEVSRPELDVAELEKLVKAEASVCYRLLRYMNSAMFGFQSEIHSVRHALSILGERDVRRWVRLVAAVGAGQEKTSDLVLSALVRGRFGELLAPRVTHGESDLFLLGLLSLIDAMLEMPMADVLEKIPLDHATKAVLLGQPSALRPVYQLMLAHESGEWDAAAELSASLQLDADEVAGYYWQAQQWAREVRPGSEGGLPVIRRKPLELGREATLLVIRFVRRKSQVMSSCAKGGWMGPCAVGRTSTIKMFSFRPRSRAGLPRQPIRGGAYGSDKRKIDTESKSKGFILEKQFVSRVGVRSTCVRRNPQCVDPNLCDGRSFPQSGKFATGGAFKTL